MVPFFLWACVGLWTGLRSSSTVRGNHLVSLAQFSVTSECSEGSFELGVRRQDYRALITFSSCDLCEPGANGIPKYRNVRKGTVLYPVRKIRGRFIMIRFIKNKLKRASTHRLRFPRFSWRNDWKKNFSQTKKINEKLWQKE